MPAVPARILLAEMTREQIRAIAPDTTVVLPTAAIEQHGPHLTIMTDTLAVTTICERAAELASKDTPVTVAPPVHFGSSHHHRPHPGVLSLSQTTFTKVVVEIAESLALAGFRRIAIVNGHGGNDELVRVAARELALAYPNVTIAASSYWTIAQAALVEEGKAGELGQLPGHAGAFETSLVMALRPDLVDQTSYPTALARPPFSPDFSQRPTVIKAGSSLGAGPGYTDDPSRASADTGNRFLGIVARELAAFLVRLAQQ
jgi:creatinine amidohydrolase